MTPGTEDFAFCLLCSELFQAVEQETPRDQFHASTILMARVLMYGLDDLSKLEGTIDAFSREVKTLVTAGWKVAQEENGRRFQ